ncbi:hypothetical protein PMAYCL1PPCAC_18857 [Pristionchus mayeri]|uniref:Phospholipid/glycerol acyltransferase domain-containing protein n=1 Tax=Pristionchus mayeri TaxID=1317129 RepID=A0AAN5CQE7_9BILA|nr:hypothetical protein PMAYCL1PPCAC_18857 [Pristionchus mayeri]
MSEAVASAITRLSEFQWPESIRPHVEVLLLWMTWALDHIDFDYLEYLLWLFLPVFIIFVVPVLLVLFIYGCVIFLHVYKFRNRIREELHTSYWNGARIAIASFWDAVGYIWHGYEVHGLENIPDEGPALFIYFHGCLPIDIYYLMAKCVLHKNRSLHCVGDNFIFKIPGWGLLTKVFSITPGTVEDCTANLKAGNLLSIAPGGVREALFSDPRLYDIMWSKRMGFAKVVLASQAPVIPMFTENCRDAFRVPEWGRSFFRWVYEKTKAPLCPIYGGFPVKMITHLGPPMTFDYENTSPEEIRKQLKREIRGMIREHQQLPGSVFRGIAQRFVGKKQKQTTPECTRNAKVKNVVPEIELLQRNGDSRPTEEVTNEETVQTIAAGDACESPSEALTN